MSINLLNYIFIAVTISGLCIVFILYSNLFERKISKELQNTIKDFPSPVVKYFHVSKTYLFFKRFLDILFSLIAIIILSPTFIIIYIINKKDYEDSCIFSQERLGLNGNIFRYKKFRTMKFIKINKIKKMILEDPKITPFGRFLRRTSFDELPGLFSILKGDMSLVGRSPSLDYVIKNNLLRKDQIDFLLKIKPGLLNIWILLPYNKKFNFNTNIAIEFYYSYNRSVTLDFMILVKSVILGFGKASGY